MEPKIVVISERDVGLRLVRRVIQGEGDQEYFDSGVTLETTRGGEVTNDIFIGDSEIPKLLRGLRQMTIAKSQRA